MTEEKFLAEFQNILQKEDEISMDTKLSTIQEWDSLAMMSCIAWLDKKFLVKTTFKDYKQLITIADLMALAQRR
jgi:acyl carrier protein